MQKSNITPHELRSLGYKVRVCHWRMCRPAGRSTLLGFPIQLSPLLGRLDKLRGNLNMEIMPKGGKTVVQLRTPTGQELQGEAVCHENENYRNRDGVALALNRALESGGFSIKKIPVRV